jgi:putative aldouronate transport system substrate-binding protein
MKRILILILALSFVITSNAIAITSQSDLAATLGDFSSSGKGNLTPYDEPITMSVGFGINIAKAFPEGDSYENNVWSRAYEEELGIKLELAFTTGDSADKINTLVATGDIPDLLCVTQSQLKLLSTSGLIRDDLYDIYYENAGEGMRTIIEGVGRDAALAQCTFDGKLMAIPILNTSPGEEVPVIYLRSDWMDKLGLEDPQNWDDLHNILKAFVAQDPDGNGIDDTIGLTFTKNLWDTMYNMPGLFNIFGSFPMRNFWVDDPVNEGKVIYGAFADETKEALKIVSQLYADGIIDPEYAVNDSNAALQHIASGKCGALIGAVWMTNAALYASVDNDPEADWKALPLVGLTGPTTPVMGNYPVIQDRYMVFNKDFEHPEAVIKMINLQFEKCFSEGTTQEIYDTYIEDSSGVSGFNAFTIYPWGIFLPAIKNEMAADEIVNLGLSSEECDVWAKPFARFIENYLAGDTSAWRWYRFFGPDGGHLVTGKYIRDDLYYMNRYYGPATDTMAENMSLIDDLVIDMFTKIIMNTVTVDEFDTYKAQAEALGLADMTQEANEWLATIDSDK